MYWQPDWKAGFDKTNVAGTVYTYIPLSPNVRSIGTKHVYYTMKEVNGRRYLLAQHEDKKAQFSLAIYTGKTPAAKGPAVKVPLALAPGRINSFRTFTGSLFIKGLSTDVNGLIQYEQGVRMQPKVPVASSKPGSGLKTLELYNCRETYVCDYYSYCGPDDRYNGRTVTVVSDYGCEEPGYEPCYDWGRSWQLDGSRTYQTCDYRDDPPTPDPDPSPTGSGDTGPTSIASNAEYLLDKPLALYGPCPGLTDSWLTQINFKPPSQVIQKISNLSPSSGMNLGGMPVNWGYFVQSIANAQGTLIGVVQ